MTDDERFIQVCQPEQVRNAATQERIEKKVDHVIEIVTVSNGKPSLVARMDAAEKVLGAAVIAADKLHAAELLAADVLEAHRKLTAITKRSPESHEVKLWPPSFKGYRLQDVAVFVMVVGMFVGMAYMITTQYVNGAKRDKSEATVAEVQARTERMERLTKALAKIAGIPEPARDELK